MTNFTPFDAVDYLDNEETTAAYLNGALEDPDPEAFLVAIRNIARSRGMKQLAEEDSGVESKSLDKAFSIGAKPRYETVMKIVRALGVNLSLQMEFRYRQRDKDIKKNFKTQPNKVEL